MFELSPITTENLIDFLGIAGTLITIIVSIHIAKTSLKNVFLQQKAENSLKRIDELPLLLNQFIDSTKALVIYTYVIPNETKRQEASQAFDETLPQLQRILLMYGSTFSIKVFIELKSLLVAAANGKNIQLADLFALLILLCAQIRQDLTSDPIGFNSFLDLFAPEMINQKEDIFISAKEYISKFGLTIELVL